MTFTEIVNEIAERMNLSSATAVARIGRSVNERYKRLASSIGIKTIERATATATTTIGNRSLTFGPTPVAVQKVMTVFDNTVTPPRILGEGLFDELRNSTYGSDNQPQKWALQLMGSKSVTVFLSSTPTAAFVLSADVLANLSTLSGVQIPAFAEDYHDILIVGGMATEYFKMKDYEAAKTKELEYGFRLSELRLYIAVSAYLDIYQGKVGPATLQRRL